MPNHPPALTYFDGAEVAKQIRGAIDSIASEALSWKCQETACSSEYRYSIESVRAEMAMQLYRQACRLGLYTSGAEASLLAYIDRLEDQLAAAGAAIVKGQAAAAALATEGRAMVPR